MLDFFLYRCLSILQPRVHGRQWWDSSFIAAYSGQDPERINLNPIRKIPIPNWNLKFTGLMNIKSFKKKFNRFSLTHGYRASYTINNFQTNFNYNPENPFELDNSGNIIPEILYSNVNS